MEIRCKCGRCKSENRVVGDRILTIVGWNEKHNKLYYVKYYECAYCGARNYVQVDTTKSRKLSNELNNVINKAMRFGASEDLRRIKDQKIRKLKFVREVALNQIENKNLYDDKGKILIKGLTLSKENSII